MKKHIIYFDEKSKNYRTAVLADDFSIPDGNKDLKAERLKDLDGRFDFCPLCECRQFYLSKDFNQLIGCTVMLCGILLVPFTYGLSLPVFALIDWLLYKRVETIINCYRCGAEFHGFNAPGRLKPFIHHIGLKYDKYRK